MVERSKLEDQINNHHKAEYSYQMAELKENHKAEFHHKAEYFTYPKFNEYMLTL